MNQRKSNMLSTTEKGPRKEPLTVPKELIFDRTIREASEYSRNPSSKSSLRRSFSGFVVLFRTRRTPSLAVRTNYRRFDRRLKSSLCDGSQWIDKGLAVFLGLTTPKSGRTEDDCFGQFREYGKIVKGFSPYH